MANKPLTNLNIIEHLTDHPLRDAVCDTVKALMYAGAGQVSDALRNNPDFRKGMQLAENRDLRGLVALAQSIKNSAITRIIERALEVTNDYYGELIEASKNHDEATIKSALSEQLSEHKKDTGYTGGDPYQFLTDTAKKDANYIAGKFGSRFTKAVREVFSKLRGLGKALKATVSQLKGSSYSSKPADPAMDEAEVTTLRQQLAEEQAKSAQLTAERDQLTAQLQADPKTSESVQLMQAQVMARLQAENASLREKQAQAAHSEHPDTEQQIAQLQHQIEALNQALQDASQKEAASSEDLENLQQQIEELKAENERLKAIPAAPSAPPPSASKPPSKAELPQPPQEGRGALLAAIRDPQKIKLRSAQEAEQHHEEISESDKAKKPKSDEPKQQGTGLMAVLGAAMADRRDVLEHNDGEEENDDEDDWDDDSKPPSPNS